MPGETTPSISGAVEILKFVVKLDSVISETGVWHAAMIADRPGGDSTPGISDAVEILKWVVRLPDNALTRKGIPFP
jgi:hypothetical protein